MTRTTTSPNPSASPRPAAQRPRTAGPTIDPIRVLRQHARSIMVIAFLGGVLGVGLNFAFASLYPLWSAQVLFEIKSQLEMATDLNAKDIGTEDTVVRLAQTEVAKLTSRDTLNDALQRPEILTTEWSKGYQDANGVLLLDEAVQDLEDEIRSGHRRGTQIFFIAWRAHVPEDSRTVLNCLADTYILKRKIADDARFAMTQQVYETKRSDLDKSINQVKTDIQKFINANGLTSLTEGNSQHQRTLEKLSSDIAQTTADHSVAKTRVVQIGEKMSSKDPSQDDKKRAQEDPIVLGLRRDAEDLARAHESSKSQFGEKHSTYIRIHAESEAAKKAYERQLEETLSRNLLADQTSSINDADSLAKLLLKQTDDFKDAGKLVAKFTESMAEMRDYEAKLEMLQLQRTEIGKTIQDIALAKERQESDRVEIVQRALKPLQITFPRMEYMVPGAAVLCLAIYILILFSREFLDQRVKYPSDLAGIPGKMLGAIPELSDDPSNPKRAEFVVTESPESVLAENFRQLNGQVAKALHAAGGKSLLVLSAMPESGTTTVAINFATAEATLGNRVLLIGANMRRPGLSRAFGVDIGAAGLGEALTGRDPAKCITSVKPNVDLMGAGGRENRVFDRLSTPQMDAIMKWAKEHYDLVVVDGPPSIVAGEALVLANKVDATLIVTRAWQDQRGLVMKLANQMAESPSAFLGVVLNRMHMTAGGYLRKNAEAIAAYAEHTAAFGGLDSPALPPRDVKIKKPKAA